MAKMSKTKKRGVASACTFVFLIVLFFVLYTGIGSGSIGRYHARIMSDIGIWIVAAVSLNMVTGLMGQLVLGHAGFMLVGAYVSAIFVSHSALDTGISIPIGLLLAGVSASVIGLVIGLPALRLRGDYLAIITLGFGEIIRVVANNMKITNGAMGLSGIPSLPTRAGMFAVIFWIACFTVAFSYTFGTSRHGRAVLSIREDEIAAEASGVNTTYYKLLTFALSAFFAGVAGGLYAHHIRLIDPAQFDFNRSVEILMMVVLGGMGSITGSVIAAIVLTLLPVLLIQLADWRMLIYSVVLIVVMLFRPQGLLGRREISVIAPFEKLLARIKKGGGKKAAQNTGAPADDAAAQDTSDKGGDA